MYSLTCFWYDFDSTFLCFCTLLFYRKYRILNSIQEILIDHARNTIGYSFPRHDFIEFVGLKLRYLACSERFNCCSSTDQSFHSIVGNNLRKGYFSLELEIFFEMQNLHRTHEYLKAYSNISVNPCVSSISTVKLLVHFHLLSGTSWEANVFKWSQFCWFKVLTVGSVFQRKYYVTHGPFFSKK